MPSSKQIGLYLCVPILIAGLFSAAMYWYLYGESIRAESFRETSVKALMQASQAYLEDNGSLPGNYPWQIGLENATDICAPTVQSTACNDLHWYLVPDYLPDLPVDPASPDARFSGFAIYLNLSGDAVVFAQHAEPQE